MTAIMSSLQMPRLESSGRCGAFVVTGVLTWPGDGCAVATWGCRIRAVILAAASRHDEGGEAEREKTGGDEAMGCFFMGDGFVSLVLRFPRQSGLDA